MLHPYTYAVCPALGLGKAVFKADNDVKYPLLFFEVFSTVVNDCFILLKLSFSFEAASPPITCVWYVV